MRIAIVSDIHGNRTAFEAVLADLRKTSPDFILNGGDLAQGGARPAEIVDRIRDLGWPGVVGNTDEMLFKPESLKEFASQSPTLQPLFAAIEDMATAAREWLGEDRLAWLSGLPRIQIHDPVALVHASSESRWRAPAPEASDAELESVYSPLARPVAIYGHIIAHSFGAFPG
jgi:Icc-related predicted phosphoesterase